MVGLDNVLIPMGLSAGAAEVAGAAQQSPLGTQAAYDGPRYEREKCWDHREKSPLISCSSEVTFLRWYVI